MINRFTPGQIVTLENLTHSSYYLYRSYEKYSKIMVCPCKISKTKLLEVVEQIENIVILKVVDQDILTVVYEKDLEGYYEKSDS